MTISVSFPYAALFLGRAAPKIIAATIVTTTITATIFVPPQPFRTGLVQKIGQDWRMSGTASVYIQISLKISIR